MLAVISGSSSAHSFWYLFPLKAWLFTIPSAQVDSGYRMPPPAGCPKEVHNIMNLCWMYEPEDRSNFTGVLDMLKAIK